MPSDVEYYTLVGRYEFVRVLFSGYRHLFYCSRSHASMLDILNCISHYHFHIADLNREVS